jgi:hypothetical protein
MLLGTHLIHFADIVFFTFFTPGSMGYLVEHASCAPADYAKDSTAGPRKVTQEAHVWKNSRP